MDEENEKFKKKKLLQKKVKDNNGHKMDIVQFNADARKLCTYKHFDR